MREPKRFRAKHALGLDPGVVPVRVKKTRQTKMLVWPILATTMALAVPARAQTYDPSYPVCMHLYGSFGGGDNFDCSFTSLPQCQASASGRSATCDANPYFAPVREVPLGSPRQQRRVQQGSWRDNLMTRP